MLKVNKGVEWRLYSVKSLLHTLEKLHQAALND